MTGNNEVPFLMKEEMEIEAAFRSVKSPVTADRMIEMLLNPNSGRSLILGLLQISRWNAHEVANWLNTLT